MLTQLKDLQMDGLVERWQDLASLVCIQELFCEFVKAEVTKEVSFGKKNYLNHEDGRTSCASNDAKASSPEGEVLAAEKDTYIQWWI